MDNRESPVTVGPAKSAVPTLLEVERRIAALITRGASLSAAERSQLVELGKLRKQLGGRGPINIRRLAPR